MRGPQASVSGDNTVIRRWLLAILTFGLVGLGTELLLMEHYQSGIELVPLVAVVLAFIAIIWHGVTWHARSTRALQATMVLFLVVGATGIGFHFRGAAEFQLEIDPSARSWDVFKKAMRAKAPPVLAPGLMVQLGLVGLAYAYRHPTLTLGDSGL